MEISEALHLLALAAIGVAGIWLNTEAITIGDEQRRFQASAPESADGAPVLQWDDCQ